VVGRDVLFGTALGVTLVLTVRGVDLWTGGKGFASFPGATELLEGMRSTVGVVLQAVPSAMRNVLLYFFLLFVLRVFLRSQWAAAVAFATFFAVLSALGNDDEPWTNAVMGFLYFGSGAFVVLRWGLLAYAVGVFVTELLMKLPATLDTSAWYFGNMALLVAIALGLASWGLYAALRGHSPLSAPYAAQRERLL